MTKLTEKLWLGDLRDGSHVLLDSHDERQVLNVAADGWYGGIVPASALRGKDWRRSHKVGLIDGPGNTYAQFRAAILLGDALMGGGQSLLIHCIGGVSRSPAVAAAVLCHNASFNLGQAVEFIKKRRPEVEIRPELLELAGECMRRAMW